MAFRLFLAALTAASFACFVWVARHKSVEGDILGRYSLSYASLVLLCFLVFAALCVVNLPSVYQKVNKFRAKLLLLMTSITLTLICIEVAIRLIDPMGVSYFEHYTRAALDRMADPDPNVSFVNTPGLRREYGDVEVTINDMGFRDRPVGPKDGKRFRILCLGDAVTFGWGVSAEDTFCERLATNLSAWRGRPVDVINMGVVQYNTVQEWNLFRRHSDSLDPDMVLLLYVRNDVARATYPYNPSAEVSIRGKNPAETIRTLLGKSWTYRLVWHAAWGGTGPRAWKRPERFSSDWQRSMDSIRRLAEACRVRRIPFVLFFLDRKKYPSGVDAIWEDVSSVADEEGVHLCRTRDWWPEAPKRDFDNSIIDGHPNAAGHEVLAAGMERFVLDNGLVPKP
jgi:lysophospholipase L1-like esterase